MPWFWLFTGIFLTLAINTLSFDHSQITVFPKDGRRAGVFMLAFNGGFNVSQAREVCLFLNATIATKAQVETALQHGLETCKFGWIHEEILVIPRIERSMKCGKNKTGVLTWKVPREKLYNTFCFKSQDLEKPLDTTPPDVRLQRSKTPTTTATTTVSTSSLTTTVKSKPKVPVFRKLTTEVWKTTKAALLKSTLLSSSMLTSTTTFLPSSSSPPFPLSTIPSSHSFSTSSQFFLHSASSTGPSSSTALPSVSSPNLPSRSITVVVQSVSSPASSIGAIPMAFLILATILLLLAMAAAVVWYSKMHRNIFRFWCRKRQKEEVETEMWKPSNSEMDLHDQHTEEEEDQERKYSSDITLCMKPETKTISP